MIVITKIKTVTTPRDYYQFVDLESEQNIIRYDSSEEMKAPEFVSELIRGRRYKDDKKGIDVVLGCSKKVTEDLGILLLHLAHDNIKEELDSCREKLNKISHYSFWKRLKYLFTGTMEAGE